MSFSSDLLKLLLQPLRFFSEKFYVKQEIKSAGVLDSERRGGGHLLFLSKTRHSTRKGVIKVDSSEEMTGNGLEESPLVTNAKRICAEPGS